MSAAERYWTSVAALEHRERPLWDPSHVRMPNGSLVASTHAGFLAAATREALKLWGEAPHPRWCKCSRICGGRAVA